MTDFADAYAGAREDLLIWKGRALVAEEANRKLAKLDLTDDQIISLFKKLVGGDTGAWMMYRDEIVALYRHAITQASEHNNV